MRMPWYLFPTVFRSLLIAAFFLALTACGEKSTAPSTASAPAAELAREDITIAKLGDLNHTIPLTGNLQALRQTSLTAQVEGVLAHIAVRPGADVSGGQELAQFDTHDLEKQLLVSQAQLAKSRELLAYNNKLAERNADLVKQNFISRNAFDASNNQVQTSAADVKVSEAQLALAKQALAKSHVLAPFAGTISERLVEPGQRVGVNSKLFTLVDLSELEWVATVPAGQISEVRRGQIATLNADGFAETFTGQVSRINPSVDANSKSVQIYIHIANDQRMLRDGLFARGRLRLNERKNVLILPAAAVREENSKHYVLAIENGKLNRHDVALGISDPTSGQVEVTHGLHPGATVLVSGVRLVTGMAVKLPAGGVH